MKISCYILTFNSQRRLVEALESVAPIADELLIVDSGSTDGTLSIAAQFGARVVIRPFDDFTSQRNFALAECVHPWIFTIDSDEVLSAPLQAALLKKKQEDVRDEDGVPDAFAIQRDWIVLGRQVRCFYPSRCPDRPVRLFRKGSAEYVGGRRVHETLRGFRKAKIIDGAIMHYSCDTIGDLYGKMDRYTTLAAKDLIANHGYPGALEALVMPWLVAFRWYIVIGGWRDGAVGAVLGRYTLDTVYQKYLKARWDFRGSSQTKIDGA